MRMSGRALTDYAAAVHLADFKEQGDADLIEKLFNDLNRFGVATTRQIVRRKLAELHRKAVAQTGATD